MARPDNALEYGPDGVPYLGSRLRELRRAAGWSVTALSKHVGRTVAALSKIETNHARPSKALLQSLAGALGVEMTDLEAAPLHPRLGVPPERDVPDDSVEQRDSRDEEISGLKDQNRKLIALIERVHRFMNDASIDKWVGPWPDTYIIVLVLAPDKPGLLADITQIFAKGGVNILRARSGVAQAGEARIAIEASAEADVERVVAEIRELSCDYRVQVLQPEKSTVTSPITASGDFPDIVLSSGTYAR